jgi:RNA polymerase sigma-70 factor (ECF subfamily)
MDFSSAFFVIPATRAGHDFDMTVVSELARPKEEAREVESDAPAAPTASGPQRLRAMVDDYFDFIWRSLRRLGVAPADADDAAQQVFWIASRKIDEIAPGKERPFLFGTAMRVAADARRARRRRPEHTGPELPDMADSSPGPDERLEQRQIREELDAILDEMPIDLGAVFVLFEIEELEMAQIALLLGIPRGTVASRLRRARDEFRERLKRRLARRNAQRGLP